MLLGENVNTDTSVFDTGNVEAACAAFDEIGCVVLRGCYTDSTLDALQEELESLQKRLVAGELPEQCGTVILDDPDAIIDGEPFAHYVCEITTVSDRAREAVMHPTVVDAVTHLLTRFPQQAD